MLSARRNDLATGAARAVPEIDEVLAALAAAPGCLLARMSGSGATCFALFARAEDAGEAAARVAEARPTLWVRASTLVEPDWTGCATLHLTGCPIIPTTTYAIAVEAGGILSADGLFDTQAKPSVKWYGDCVGFFTGTEWTAPNNQVNIDDAVAAIKTFQDRNKMPGCAAPLCNATHVSVTDLEPNLTPDNAVPPQINSIVNIADVFHFLLGFQGLDYPGPDLTQCP